MARPKKNTEETIEEAQDISLVQDEKTVDPRDAKIDALLARDSAREREMEELRAMVRDKTEASEEHTIDHTCKIMFCEDLPVINFGQVRKLPNGEESIKLVVLNNDMQEEPREMEYSKAIQNNPRYLAEIVKIDQKKEKKQQGPIQVFASPGKYGNMSDKRKFEELHSLRVPLTHVAVSSRSTIRFLEGPWKGKEIEVDADACHNK